MSLAIEVCFLYEENTMRMHERKKKHQEMEDFVAM